jgi:hypothetical protein
MIKLMELERGALDQMGEHARRHVAARFSLDSVHTRYKSLYEQILLAAS